MIISYISLTGNVKRFVDKLGINSIKIDENTIINEQFIVMVPTYNEQIELLASKFIEHNSIDYLIGFVGSGNKNFDVNYVSNARNMAKKYNKPLLFSFELSGTDLDVENFKREVCKFDNLL